MNRPSLSLTGTVPSQTRHPWRATVRTWFQGALGAAALIPVVVPVLDLPAGPVSAAAAGLVTVAAIFTRVMALPQVEAFLRRFLPWLSATGKPADWTVSNLHGYVWADDFDLPSRRDEDAA